MDPNSNLKEQRKLTAAIIAAFDSEYDKLEEIAEMANRLAELQQALDQWLSRGGFKPDDWQTPNEKGGI